VGFARLSWQSTLPSKNVRFLARAPHHRVSHFWSRCLEFRPGERGSSDSPNRRIRHRGGHRQSSPRRGGVAAIRFVGLTRLNSYPRRPNFVRGRATHNRPSPMPNILPLPVHLVTVHYGGAVRLRAIISCPRSFSSFVVLHSCGTRRTFAFRFARIAGLRCNTSALNGAGNAGCTVPQVNDVLTQNAST